MKNNLDVVHRAWNRLRMALLWTRKSGTFRRKLVMELRLMQNNLKCLGHTTAPLTQTHYYCEREFSFDNTLNFHVKMYRSASSKRLHLLNISCINPPQADFDDDQDVEYDHGMGLRHHDEESHYGYQEEEKEIDKRADEFIAKFYQNLKLQRQISYLQ